MNGNLNEIRINEYYSSFLNAEYENSLSDESNPTTRKNIVRTDRYLEKITNKFTMKSFDNDLIPPNCRFIKRGLQGTVVVIEEPPAIRSIRVNKDMSHEAESLKAKGEWQKFGYENFFEENFRPYTFMIAVPYVIHIMLLQNSTLQLYHGKVFLNTRSLLGMGDRLFISPFLNIGSGMNVCFGDEVNRNSTMGITRKIDHVIRTFWGATFNSDYIDNYLSYVEIPGLCDYFTWQYYSRTNPMFIYTADWIPYEKPIGNIISDIMYSSNFGIESNRYFSYKTLEEIFSNPEVSDEKVKVGSLQENRNLIYDISQGLVLPDNTTIFIGDAFNYSKNRVAHIDCFIGIQRSISTHFVRINLNGKLLRFKLTNKVREFLETKILELRYEAKIILPDGREFSSGDIISFKDKYGITTYQKISYIRKNLDEKLEIRVGSSFWFADSYNWETVNKVSMDEPEIDGIKIKKDVIYRFFNSLHRPTSEVIKAYKTKFKRLNTSGNKLILEFEEITNGDIYRRELTKTDSNKFIISPENMETIPPLFACGRKLFSVYTSDSIPAINKSAGYGIILDPVDNLSRPSLEQANEYLLSSDKQHFHLETTNFKIDFSVGDKVIVANWTEPLTMLSVKTITGFESKDEQISFLLKDKHDKITKQVYVDVYRGVVSVGKIRKVANQIDDIKVGTKIVARETGISCFPKKDVNIIISFLIDTGGEPLVFCSNGCTLWLSDLKEKFDLIPISSPKWKDLKHSVLDPSKIKLQPGDIVNGQEVFNTSCGYLVVGSHGGGVRITRLETFHEYDDYMQPDRYFNRELILDCIPNPRLTVRQQLQMGLVRNYPNFHGGLAYAWNWRDCYSPFLLLNETRRFLNV
jgi:hypothetical protein